MNNTKDQRLLEYYGQRILNGKIIIAASAKSPRKITLYGAKTSKPKWWQFWRWHKSSKWKQECIDAYKKFAKDFDIPIKD